MLQGSYEFDTNDISYLLASSYLYLLEKYSFFSFYNAMEIDCLVN